MKRKEDGRPLEELQRELTEATEPERAEKLYSFFRAVPGGYGEGDEFLGVRVPVQRKIAKRYYRHLLLDAVEVLLRSSYHEYRLTALLVLVEKYKKAHEDERRYIVDLYLRNLSVVNNWDLVDSSADKILGAYLYEHLRKEESDDTADYEVELLYDLAESGELWSERVSIISTYYFIRKGRFEETFACADILLNHPHDLIHKAVGWMLREVGKREFGREFEYLKIRYASMPRTMLRYAVEKFDEDLRRRFLKGEV